MSITAPDPRITTYSPVVATTTFAADFPVFDNSDLTVIHNGSERSDFMVMATYVGSISNDARVVFDPGLIGNVLVVGAREPRRSNRFGAGPINANMLNAAFDTVQGEMQEAHRDIGRSHRAPYGEQGGIFSASDIGDAQDNAEKATEAAEATAQDRAFIDLARNEVLAAVPNSFPLTRVALKGINTALITSAYLKEPGREGQFFWRAGNYAAQIALDTAEGVFIKANAVAASVGAWVRVVGDKITPMMFGAKADGVTNDYPLCLIAFNVAKLLRLPFHLPTGNFLWDLSGIGTAEWDPTIDIRGAWRAIPITGDGATLSCVTIVNATGIGWYIHSVSGRHWFNPKLSGLTVRGDVDGSLVAFGRNDFADYPNMIDSDDLAVENSMNTANNRAVRINGMYGGSIRRPRFVSYALAVDDVIVAVNGYGLECRQAEFIHIDAGGIGNGASAVRVVDGVNLLLKFTSVTMENVDFCFDHQSASSGHHKLETCQLTNVRVAALRSTGILSNAKIVVEEPNISGGTSTGVDATSYEGILIRDRAGVVTPASPVSGVPFANKTGRDVEISYWGPATMSGITVDGFSRGTNATSGSFLFKAGSVGTMNFTGSTNWQWTNAG